MSVRHTKGFTVGPGCEKRTEEWDHQVNMFNQMTMLYSRLWVELVDYAKGGSRGGIVK